MTDNLKCRHCGKPITRIGGTWFHVGEPISEAIDCKNLIATPVSPTEEMKSAIADVLEARKSHLSWAEWFESHPEEERKYTTTGEWDTASTHREWVMKYDRLLRLLAFLSTEQPCKQCGCTHATAYELGRVDERGLVKEERDRLKAAIEKHRSQKADDRCIEDDDELYAALGDGIKCDRRVGDKAAMLKNCERFIDRRCEGGGWPSYAELEAVVKKLDELDWVIGYSLDRSSMEILYEALTQARVLLHPEEYKT